MLLLEPPLADEAGPTTLLEPGRADVVKLAMLLLLYSRLDEDELIAG